MRCSDVLLCGSKSWVEAAGYLASLLVFATFCMKTMLQLRITAILSNVAFIAYAFFDGLYPILILHSVLLPLNAVRTVQMLRVRRIAEQASKGKFTTEPLCPFMVAGSSPAGPTSKSMAWHSRSPKPLSPPRKKDAAPEGHGKFQGG
ncbi:hypothetical protein ACVIHI_004616 [Bradyrhizobium sp. USDA 4524]|uniref:hypothetical protein n=1 Tax=unclassified Bradyrhizobium TaxID=2631580 RepID=UPI0020A232C4|nr:MULTISPECIES: hypothetical protein [unclassified Bradyrhizobium]